MKARRCIQVAFGVFLIGVSTCAKADDMDDAAAAYRNKDYANALRLVLPLADRGDAKAECLLGTMYQYGSGVPKDVAESLRLIEASANQDYPRCEDKLGVMFQAGINGVSKDDDAALAWLRKAADQGYALGEADLGFYYQLKGAHADYAQALAWSRKAADQDSAFGEGVLGSLYEFGHGVPQDDAEAARWYRKSADHGDPVSQMSVGAMYATGRGVPQDFVEAYKWLCLSAALDEKFAGKKRNALAGVMTPEQIVQAQKLVKEWLKK